MPDWSSALRSDLSRRARAYGSAHSTEWYESLGTPPTVLFPANLDAGRHGNFQPDAYAAIKSVPGWSVRLVKAHAQRAALPEQYRAQAGELDSCNSSDALLMNCFCYPNAAKLAFEALLPGWETGDPEFGVAGSVPLQNGDVDTTEIDMRAGKVIFESKLTEPDFTTKSKPAVRRYREFSSTFEADLLPQAATEYANYQLIRNVLAAQAHDYSFVLLCDARRPDLLHAWWTVHAAIRSASLRARCGFLLWQEVAAAVPSGLRGFLAEKYGIT